MNMAYDGGGHLSEDDLVLHYYGEGTLPEVDAHLAGCDACRANLRALQRVLNVVDTLAVPERGAEYGAEVWAKIGGQLPRAPRWGWLWKPRQWVWSGALAGLLVAAPFFWLADRRGTALCGDALTSPASVSAMFRLHLVERVCRVRECVVLKIDQPRVAKLMRGFLTSSQLGSGRPAVGISTRGRRPP